MYRHIPQGPAPGRALGPGPLRARVLSSGPGPGLGPAHVRTLLAIYVYVYGCMYMYTYICGTLHELLANESGNFKCHSGDIPGCLSSPKTYQSVLQKRPWGCQKDTQKVTKRTPKRTNGILGGSHILRSGMAQWPRGMAQVWRTPVPVMLQPNMTTLCDTNRFPFL